MYLSYNGVTLKLLTLDSVIREAVWTPDGVDLLYVRWRIGCSCVYAPGEYQTGVAIDGPVPTTPGARSGLVGNNPVTNIVRQGNTSLPITTDYALRNILFQNRKPLVIWGYDAGEVEKVWLQSPTPGALSDADNGPKIHACNVVSATGAPSNMAVQLEIETCIPPCPDGSDRPLLAHRWQMTHLHDARAYLTRQVDGEAVFHPGLMHQFKQNPDWFRGQLFHPVPLGFQRSLGPIVQSSDGCVLSYQYTDVDTTVVFDAGDTLATSIDIQEQLTHINPNPILVAAAAAAAAIKIGTAIAGRGRR